jgi:hypothetical protein
MALARTHAIALVGVQGHVVEIEVDIENGLVALLLVGLPDTALREARDRIRSAIVNSQQSWPQRRITVGLSPASLPKRGSGFDLATSAPFLSLVTSASRRAQPSETGGAGCLRTWVHQLIRCSHADERSGRFGAEGRCQRGSMRACMSMSARR